MKSEKGRLFSYRDLNKVYTIIFYEKSTEEFKAFKDTFIHHATMVCETNPDLNFLQEYYLVALDVFQKSEYAKLRNPEDRLAGWLSFFCTQNSDDAEALCQTYPWLSDFYVEMSQFGRKPEELIGMFSEMLREMDRNTVRYMVDDMQEKIEKQKQILAENEASLAENAKLLAAQEQTLAVQEQTLVAQAEEIKRLRALLAETQKN